MVWPKDESTGTSIDHFEEFTYRTADGAKVELPTIPAGLAWDALPASKKDNANVHPTPNGAYLVAATIYAHMLEKSAATSEYIYDNELVEMALSTITNEKNQTHYTEQIMV